jgi:hypothetical protein
MGIEYNPVVDTNGLIYWYDTGNTRSYSGSGSALSSLPGGSAMNLYNGYSTSGSGATLSISLNGTNAYTLTETNLYAQFPTSSTSMFIWAYSSAAGNIVSELGQATINTAWHDSNIEINSSGVVSMSVWHGSLTNRVTSSAISFNTWYQLGWAYNGTTLTGYINGLSIGTTTFTRSRNGSAIYYTIGAPDSTNMGTNSYWNGRFSSFSVYNRSLTAAEVLKNYNSSKKRYGY